MRSLMTVCSDDSVSVYELQRRSADSEEWKTVKKNVVDFGIQGDFLYASVYKDDHPDTVGFFFFFFCIVSNFNIFLKGFFVCLFFGGFYLFVCRLMLFSLMHAGLFGSFHYPPDSDVNCWNFNAHTWSFACVCTQGTLVHLKDVCRIDLVDLTWKKVDMWEKGFLKCACLCLCQNVTVLRWPCAIDRTLKSNNYPTDSLQN